MRALGMKWFLALVISLAGVSSAHAKLIDLGTLSEGTYVFGDYFAKNGPFSDTISFSLDAPAQIDGLVASLGILLDPFSKIQNLSLALSGPVSWQSSSTGTFFATTFSWASLLPGSYEFVLSGKSAGLLHGAYLGAFAVSSVAPVPEAETYVMMLVGIALVGYQLRRKQRELEQQPLALG